MRQRDHSRGGMHYWPKRSFLELKGSYVKQGTVVTYRINEACIQAGSRVRLVRRLHYKGRGCISSDVLRKKASEGAGACSLTEARRPHLHLRGKLGWMTPRAGWKQPETGCTLLFYLFRGTGLPSCPDSPSRLINA